MMKESWKYLLRTKRRTRVFTLINIVGFSFGLVCAFTIFLYIIDELSYDKFHERYQEINQVITVSDLSGRSSNIPGTPLVLTDAALAADSSLVMARAFRREAQLDIGEGKLFKERHFAFADPQLLKMFTFDFVQGSERHALADESSVMISSTLAKTLYTSEAAALGKVILVENRLPLTVKAVYRDWPAQSQFRFNMISHFGNYLKLEDEVIRNYLLGDWLFTGVTTFVLAGDADRDRVERFLNDVRMKNADERVRKGEQYHVKPLRDLHLYSDFRGSASNNQIMYIYIFLLIGGLVLFMACINFINLSIATSIGRLKEISLRKVLGAGQRNLIIQYIGESFTYLLISLMIAGTVTVLVLPYVNTFLNKELSVRELANPYFITAIIMTYLVTGLVTGLVPGLFTAKVNPVLGIKGYVSNTFKAVSFIRPLVVTQLVISSVLLLFMFVIDGQIRLFRDSALGFQKEHIVNVPLFMENLNSIFGGVDGPLRERMNAFETALLEQAPIEAVTASSSIPGDGSILALVQTDEIKADDNVFISFISVDYDFLATYRIPVVAGRSFAREAGADHLESFILNETARRRLGFENDENALGANIELVGKKGKVVGVVRDFHFQGLQESVGPLALEVSANKFTTFSIRINSRVGVPEALAVIEDVWNKFFPERYFEYYFLDDSFNENYQSQFRLAQTVRYFTMIAAIIAIIGLFGLTAFTSSFYLKEVSIRKISGASDISMLIMLLLRQMKIVVYAVLIGFPVGYWLAKEWLATFAYRIPVSWSIFIVTVAVVIGLMVISTLFHFIKTARVNPLDVVKSE